MKESLIKSVLSSVTQALIFPFQSCSLLLGFVVFFFLLNYSQFTMLLSISGVQHCYQFLHVFTVIFKTALLKYNLHTIKFIHFMCRIQLFLVNLQSCAIITTIQFYSISGTSESPLYLLAISPHSQPQTTSSLPSSSGHLV